MEESVRHERKKAGNVVWVEQVLERDLAFPRKFCSYPELKCDF